MRKSCTFRPVLSLLFVVASHAVCAQVATGTPPFGSFGGGPDIINLANLNAHLAVPVLNKQGRAGMNFSYAITYDSSVWYPTLVNGVQTWQPVQYWGWSGPEEAATGYVSYKVHRGSQCPVRGDGNVVIYDTYVYHDAAGVAHAYSSSAEIDCNGMFDGFSETAADGSGYLINVTDVGMETITTASGYVINPTTSTGGNSTDTNGNQITYSSSTGQFFDTLSSTVPVLTITGTEPITFAYTAPSGGNASYIVNYTTFTVQTNFGCGGSSAVAEYGPTQVSLVSSITLPDNTSYSFNYEPTPGHSGNVTGRLASVTLPTGGMILYSYSGGSNGITCTDGSAAGLNRQTPDGTWTYTRSGSSPTWTTNITDPQGNVTALNFYVIYETQRQLYQGSAQPSNLLATITTCYNGAGGGGTNDCTGIAQKLPISERSITLQWGQSGLKKLTDIFNDMYGQVLETDEYDYASGPPFTLRRKTLITYASLGNNIVNRPYQVTIQDGSGNTKAQTTYSYDQGTVAGTSGTPQHNSVSGSRGNVTTIAQLVQGGTTLSGSFTYFDTGNVQTATGVNNAQTTLTYGACGNSFPTQVSLPLSLSRSMAWNCTGGVMTSLTDENNQTASTTYSDPYFWRPGATTDQALYATNITYTGATAVESVLSFNGANSVADALATLDSLGRPHVSQRRQSPGSANFDSVETDYDSLGRPSRVTVPYAGTAGQMNGSVPATTTSYDALSRVTQTTDGGGGTVMLSFSQNDVLSTVGPAPQNENSKRRQLEYDSLGRLTSVCEVTTATGSGTCGQSSSATGYWTKYTYDALNNLIVVTQNAQSSGSTQTRNYSYDDLSRLTSETNPETGTTTYTYDSDSTCGSTSSGDLVKRIDAVGNTTCYFYDALHRVTSTTYSGSYASRTPAKCYVYDGATVNSQTMANAKGRLAEAYTAASCPNGTKTTDIGMSYSARGEVTDVWESTPHSGGYYHANASYWANGALNTLSGLGLPTLTYSADGEGRPSSVSASSGTNPVTSTAYNVSSQPTGLTFGTSDSDGFSFDGNSGRMKQYTFTVGASPNTVTGQLTWNANGTLQQLAITDQFNSANTQTCNYSYDDLVRIAGVNCGSVWSQTFGFDPFGNLTKSGSVSFQPTYNTSTNRMQSLPGFTPTYDANGNTTADSLHTYAWDVDGNSTTIDSLTVTYDALDRMVEQASGSTYTESAYGPAGTKLALMNGQSLVKAFVPLPAGAVAVYGSGGTLSYFRHPDWLGSSRFSSTTSRTMYYSRAYAPFGETYAESGTQERAFAGMNQDTVQSSTSGLYDALFREYEQYGRWVSPDPAGLAAVDPTNPQTWNRYAYVANNPLSGVDPLGLCGDGVTWDCPMIDEKDGTWGFLGPDIMGVFQQDFTIQPSDWNRGCDFLKLNFNVMNCNFQLVSAGGAGGGTAAANNCQPGTPGCFNVPTRKGACLAEYNNSAVGKGMQFLSLYNFASNLGSLKTWAEWTALPAAKVLTLSAVSKLSQAFGNTEFLSVTGGTSTVVTAPTAAGITATESAGSVVAPLAILGATAGDMSMNSYCSGYTVPPGQPIPHGH